MPTSTTQIPGLEDCIEACQRCQQVCLETAMTQCLEQGGKHVEAEHFRLMLNCADLCHTAANFMLSRSMQHAAVCAVCADVCTACADSCEQIGDMDECARVCRDCAQRCQAMGMQRPQQRSGAQTQPRM